MAARWFTFAAAHLETRGSDPNPRSNPEGVSQALWLVRPGEKPQRIADGNSPAMSPKTDRIAYIYKDQVWSAAHLSR